MKNKLSKISVYSYLIDAIHIEAKIFELENEDEEEEFDKDKIFEYYTELYESYRETDKKEVIKYIEEMHTLNYYNNYIDLGVTYKWRPL